MALLDFASAPYGGERRLLPESRAQARIRPTQLIFHSIVGSAAGALNFFRGSSALESTFIVAKSGRIWQLLDTERRADANYLANDRAGSVETEDNGDPDADPWTPEQLASLHWIAMQYHRVHGVPLRQCPAWNAPGIGYHRLFREWTVVPGKTCPGDVRVRQFHQVLLPAIVRREEPDVSYGHWPADHRRALVRDVAAQVKNDVLGLQRLMLQFLAAGQYNSVFPGEPRPGWAEVAVSTAELGERLQRLADELGQEGLPVTAPAPDVIGRPPTPTFPDTTPETPPEAPGTDRGEEPWAVPGGLARERQEVAEALQARIDNPVGPQEGDHRLVDLVLLSRAVELLRAAPNGTTPPVWGPD